MSPRTKRRRQRKRKTTRRRFRRAWRATGPVRDDIRFMARWVKLRTTAHHCGRCKPAQRIPASQLRSHMQMHHVMDRERTRQGKTVRDRTERRRAERDHDEARARRPVNRQKAAQWPGNPGGPMRPQDKQPSPRVRVVPEEGRTDGGWTVWDGRGKPPADWAATGYPPRTQSPATTREPGDGARWKARTHNPGGTPVTPERPPPVSTSTGGSTTPPPKPSTPRTGKAGGSSSGGSGHHGEVGMTSAANAWASRMPEFLDASRGDSDAMANDMHGVADALRRRAAFEMDRGMAPEIVEPYEAAARLLSQAGEQVQEVTVRMERKYRELADRLNDRNTPNAGFLSPENVTRGR